MKHVAYPGAVRGRDAYARRQRSHPDASTDPSGTVTSRGYIRHLRHGELRCPVRLVALRTARGMMLARCPEGLPIPLMRGGAYVFALPGGYSVPGPVR